MICEEGPEMLCDKAEQRSSDEVFELEVRKLVLHIPTDLAKKSLSKPAKKTGKKDAVFQGLPDISKVLSESNWTTDGVENFRKTLMIKNKVSINTASSRSQETDTNAEGDFLPRLHKACKENEKETVTKLVNSETIEEIIRSDTFGFTALHTASLAGHLDIVKILLDIGCPADVADDKGWTPLHLACLSGHAQVTEALIENGADLAKETVNGIQAIHIASRYGHSETVKALLVNGADVEAKQSKGCMACPLHLAAFCGHIGVIDVLLQHQASIESEDVWRWRPLHFACQEGHVEVVGHLMQSCRSQPAESSEVHAACPHGHTRLYKALLSCTSCSRDDKGNVTVCSTCQETYKLPLGNLLSHHQSSDRCIKEGVTGLYLAAQNGHAEVVELLLKTGACSEVERSGLSALHIACYKGHAGVVRLFLQYLASVDTFMDDVLLTPLHLASIQGHKTIVEALLQAGALPDQRDKSGFSPLHIACIHGHNSLLSVLLEKVHDVYKSKKAGSELLTLACKYGSADAVKILVHWIPNIIENAADSAAVHAASSEGKVDVLTILLEHNLSPSSQVYGSAPIHKAAEKGHANITEILLRYGATVNNVNSKSFTPLQLACMHEHSDVARVLLEEKSVDLEARDRNGRTALHIAAGTDSYAIIKQLLQKGADVNAQDSDYKTPLYDAQNPQVVGLLLASRADANIPTSLGDTPLHKACQLGLDQVVASLLSAKANLEARDNYGQTPLLKACQSNTNRFSISRMLIERNAEVNTADYQGLTPLHEACKQGDQDLTKLLLQHHSKVDMEDDAGETPLHKACAQGSTEVITALLEAQASVNKINSEGNTPLHKACANLHPDVVRVLLDAGAVKCVKNEASMSPVDIVRSMALIPAIPALGEEEDSPAADKTSRKLRRKEILAHFVESNPPSARSSQNVEVSSDFSSRSSPSPQPSSHSHSSSPSSSLPRLPPRSHSSLSSTDSFQDALDTLPPALPVKMSLETQPPLPAKISRDTQPPLPAKTYLKKQHRKTFHNPVSIESSTRTTCEGANEALNNTNTLKVLKTSVELTMEPMSSKPQIDSRITDAAKLDDPSNWNSSQDSNDLPPVAGELGQGNRVGNANNIFLPDTEMQSAQEYNAAPLDDDNVQVQEKNHNDSFAQREKEIILDDPHSYQASKPSDETAEEASSTSPIAMTAENVLTQDNVKKFIQNAESIHANVSSEHAHVSSEQATSTSSTEATTTQQSTEEKKIPLKSPSLMKTTEESRPKESPALSASAKKVNDAVSPATSEETTAIIMDSKYPLHAACLRGHASAVLHHLSTADINAPSSPDGHTPLHHACVGGHSHIASVLMRIGADPEVKDNQGRRPLHLACGAGQLHTAHQLLSLMPVGTKLELNASDEVGNTPLHLAVEQGHIAVASLLLMIGSDVNAANNNLSTPLHLAAAKGNIALVAVLLAQNTKTEFSAEDEEVNVNKEDGTDKVKVNAADSHGDTPLMLAARGGHKDCCLLLLTARASMEMKNERGESAECIAASLNDTVLLSILKNSRKP
jgi:ankyrin repeat protein